jgi:murein DD-endopeptidase MepM/ murein hydrolase activator NlpD
LIGLKIVHLLGKTLINIFRLGAGFFRLLFKDIFYAVLAKIYYGIFKLKKNELANNAVSEVAKNHLVYFFIFSLTVLFVFTNLVDQSRAGSLETKISKTVMANLIPADLGSRQDEELIEETAIPTNILAADRAKYAGEENTLDKQDGLITLEDTDDSLSLAFNDTGDTILKPLFTSASSTGSEGFIPQRNEIVYYTVQNGDTVSTIARRFGLTVNTILWANNLSAFSLIRPGDSLTILPASGILYTVKSGDTASKIAAKYGIKADDILSANNFGSGLKAGQKLILPGARKIIEQAAIARPATQSGLSVISNLIKSPTVQAGTGKMAWPTVGYRITQYFSWRHNGVDIGNKIGTPIYAADAGVVEISQGGYNGGYGNTIVINHGNGVKTRYGHASKLFVKVGDVVEKGENIAAMGSTGRSTGPHLHFEVLINKVRYNPLNYIK